MRRSIPEQVMEKGHKSIMFLLWHQMYKYMPQTSLQLLHKIPHYGCFRDLDNIMNHYIHSQEINNEDVVYECVQVYYNYLNDDFQSLFGKNINECSHSQIRSFVNNLHSDIFKNEKDIDYPNISQVGKYIGREGRSAQFIRKYLLAMIFYPNNMEKYYNSSDSFQKFAQITLRLFCTSLNEILGTIETKMSSHRRDDIVPSNIPSVAGVYYTKYLLNIDKDGDTRSYEPSAIDLRTRTLEAAKDGKFGGVANDSVTLANKILSSLNSSTAEKILNFTSTSTLRKF